MSACTHVQSISCEDQTAIAQTHALSVPALHLISRMRWRAGTESPSFHPSSLYSFHLSIPPWPSFPILPYPCWIGSIPSLSVESCLYLGADSAARLYNIIRLTLAYSWAWLSCYQDMWNLSSGLNLLCGPDQRSKHFYLPQEVWWFLNHRLMKHKHTLLHEGLQETLIHPEQSKMNSLLLLTASPPFQHDCTWMLFLMFYF